MEEAFYARSAPDVAPDLLGKVLIHGDVWLRLTEVEAYAQEDSACHAYRGRTLRNAPMWGPPGRAYVYLCYGIHHLLNLVCAPDEVPAAVLVRAAEIVRGHEIVRARRGGRLDLVGPGKVAQALGVDVTHSGRRLDGVLRVVEGPAPARYDALPRVGIDYALPEDRDRRWRFVAR